MKLLEDLNPKIKGNKGAFLHLKHPGTGAPLYQEDVRVGLWLYGKDSDQWEAAQARRAEQQAKTRRSPLTSKDLARLMNEQLADITFGWDGIDDFPEVTPENAFKLYSSLAWVKEQAMEYLEDRANFL